MLTDTSTRFIVAIVIILLTFLFFKSDCTKTKMRKNPVEDHNKKITKAIDVIKQQAKDQVREVLEFNLDNIHFQKFNAEITEEIEKYKNSLLFLSLNNCALSSLEIFPDLPKLIRLEITDNKLAGSEVGKLSSLRALQSLSLGGNLIQNYEDLKPLTKLPALSQLDFFKCPITKDADYRQKIFSFFKNLRILDNCDSEGKDADYDQESEYGHQDELYVNAKIIKVIDQINQQVEEEGDVIQEIILYQIHFRKFYPEIVAEFEKYKDSLLFLSLNDCGLTSLENFPRLPKLIRLELADNKLTGSEVAKLSTFKNLKSLLLGGNPIQNYNDLRPLGELAQLEHIDLLYCPVSEKADYRKKMFTILKNLQVLDNRNAVGDKAEWYFSD